LDEVTWSGYSTCLDSLRILRNPADYGANDEES
jgi:hypothetical protein